jgi:hypothetical protein
MNRTSRRDKKWGGFIPPIPIGICAVGCWPSTEAKNVADQFIIEDEVNYSYVHSKANRHIKKTGS